MSGLVLKLSPKERVLINGAVIENGDRRSRLESREKVAIDWTHVPRMVVASLPRQGLQSNDHGTTLPEVEP